MGKTMFFFFLDAKQHQEKKIDDALFFLLPHRKKGVCLYAFIYNSILFFVIPFLFFSFVVLCKLQN